MSARRRRDLLTITKDLLCFGVGLGLIIRQGWYVPRADFNLWALIFGGILAQVPGISQFIAAVRTPGLLTRQPQESPSPSSVSPSSDSSTEAG